MLSRVTLEDVTIEDYELFEITVQCKLNRGLGSVRREGFTMSEVVYCPLQTETNCGYWAVFGGHLGPFIKAFKKHVRKDHSELPYGDTRDVGGLIDRWIGDFVVNGQAKEQSDGS